MNKAEMIRAASVIKSLLNKKNLSKKEIVKLEKLRSVYGEILPIKKIFNDNYDDRAIHSGFGSPDCTCFKNPPCQSCVDYTNCCDERIDEVPGCLIIGHDCPIGRGEIRA